MTNRADREAKGGTLIVYLQAPVQRLEIHLQGLAPGASLACTLDLDLPEAGRG